MTLLDDKCDGCGGRFDPMGDPLLYRRPELGPYHVFCPTCEQERRCQADEQDTAVERLTDAVSALLDQRHRLRTALDEVRALAEEWGIVARDGDFVGDEDFDEAIRENGAWRFARDLRTALDARPAGGGR